MIKNDGKNYTFDQQVEYEFKRIKGDRRDQDNFFRNAISIQNKAWDISFADGKLAVACEVLCLCGYCNPQKCDRCQLTAANKRAHQDISLGLRSHEKKEIKEEYSDIVAFTKEEFLAISSACHYISNDSNDEVLLSVIKKIDAMLEGN